MKEMNLIYIGKIAMKLKPGQVLNMNLHADDTDYIELHFWSSTILITIEIIIRKKLRGMRFFPRL